jgi:hypothetical protein
MFTPSKLDSVVPAHSPSIIEYLRNSLPVIVRHTDNESSTYCDAEHMAPGVQACLIFQAPMEKPVKIWRVVGVGSRWIASFEIHSCMMEHFDI